MLALAGETATLSSVDLSSASTFTLTARLRATDASSWTLSVGDGLTGSWGEPSGLAFGDTAWPLPMGHLFWRPDADPVYEAAGDTWEAGGVLHVDVLHTDDGAWYMAYTGFFAPPDYGYRQIGMATSTDGLSWTRPSAPFLTIDYSDDVDGVHVHMPTMVIHDGVWHVFYACYQNNVGNRICHATSLDGATWTTWGVAVDRGAEGEFDSGSLRMPAVWIDDAGTWHLWYDGTDPKQHYGPTGYATSPDGYTWTKQGEILDADHALQGLDVVEDPWGLQAFYNRDDYFVWASADPADPATWAEQGTALEKGWSWWNDGYIQAPSLALDGTTWHMYFNGYTYTDGFERIGHATGVAVPGTWVDVQLTWDGATLRGAVDGAEMGSVSLETPGPLTVTTTGGAEIGRAHV